MSANPATPEVIRAKCPVEIASKFLFDESEIEQEQLLQENQRYSCIFLTEMSITKNPKNADFTVAIDNSSDRTIRTAKVFQDPKNTHPLSMKKVLEHVNSRLGKLRVEIKANGEPKEFTGNDWKLFLNFYDIKSNKELAYKQEVGQNGSYTYSMKTVDFIVERIRENPSGVIDSLKQALKNKKNETTPGAKDSKRR